MLNISADNRSTPNTNPNNTNTNPNRLYNIIKFKVKLTLKGRLLIISLCSSSVQILFIFNSRYSCNEHRWFLAVFVSSALLWYVYMTLTPWKWLEALFYVCQVSSWHNTHAHDVTIFTDLHICSLHGDNNEICFKKNSHFKSFFQMCALSGPQNIVVM